MSLPPPAGDAANAPAAEALDTTLDWYGILSLPGQTKLGPHSTKKDIKTAYRKKAKDLHPDKNPDPKAGILFHQLNRVFEALDDPVQRAAYDAKLTAAAARAKKDASLDAALSTMKKDLLRREAEAAAARMEARNKAKEALLNPRGPKSTEERVREENEALLRNLQTNEEQAERPSKSRRTHAHDGSVHAGYADTEQKENTNTSNVTPGDEASRTLVLRWPKTSSTSAQLAHPPSAPQIQSVFSPHGEVEHVFLRPEKRKAMIVLGARDDAIKAMEQAILPAGWELKRLGDGSDEKGQKSESHHTSFPSAANSVSVGPPPSTPSSLPFSSHATTVTPPAAPLPTPDANMTPVEYEAATMARMAAIAKARKQQREQAKQQQAKQNAEVIE